MSEFSTLNGYKVKDKKAIRYYNTIADMKADTTLKEGMFVKTKGYLSINDGGDCYYYIREINNDSVDESNIIEITNTQLVAVKLNTLIINPDHFNGENDTEKLQNAINYASDLYSNGETSIKINLSRIYTITEKLYINYDNKRLPFIITSSNNGGIYSTINDLLFDTTKSNISDLVFDGLVFRSTNGSGLSIIPSPKFINVLFNNCTFKYVDKLLYTDTYLQSISLNKCLITGGNGNFIEFCGSYYLNITNCIIEQRNDKYLVYQNWSTDTMYNRQFFTNILNNIIEGFNASNETGFINITSYELINICENYFENMKNLIVHDGKSFDGVLNIKNNRLYQGGTMTNLNQKGLLYLKPYSPQNFRFGDVNFEGNKVYNTYAIYFNDTAIINKYNLINYIGNKVKNTFNHGYKINNLESNSPFNILPVVSLTAENVSSKYSRDRIINNDKAITWEETLTIDNKMYTVYFTLLNGIFTVHTNLQADINTSITYVDLYFGIDIFLDDLISTSCRGDNSSILTSGRNGSINGKYLRCNLINSNAQTSTTVIGTVQLIGRRG